MIALLFYYNRYAGKEHEGKMTEDRRYVDVIEVEPFFSDARKHLSESEIDEITNHVAESPWVGAPHDEYPGTLIYTHGFWEFWYLLSEDKAKVTFIFFRRAAPMVSPDARQGRRIWGLWKRLKKAGYVIGVKELWEWIKGQDWWEIFM